MGVTGDGVGVPRYRLPVRGRECAMPVIPSKARDTSGRVWVSHGTVQVYHGYKRALHMSSLGAGTLNEFLGSSLSS